MQTRQPDPWALEVSGRNVEQIRSLLVLEATDAIVRGEVPAWSAGRQVKVTFRQQGSAGWRAAMFASDSPSGIWEVVRGEADLAIINPSAMLTLAYRGSGPFLTPLPVRAITVLPQYDHVGLAVTAETGLHYLEEVAEARYPLKVSLRGQRLDHSIHMILADILAVAGCPIHAIESWGGRISYDPGLPYTPPKLARGRTRLQAVEAGERNAVFDEGFDYWAGQALGLGMRFLALREETIAKLTSLGYRRSVVLASDYPELGEDLQTIDFSGWPVFTHAEASDELVTAVCVGIDKRRDRIPWEGDGPLPLERMCQDTPEAPLDVPFHAAAERYWRELGYL